MISRKTNSIAQRFVAVAVSLAVMLGTVPMFGSLTVRAADITGVTAAAYQYATDAATETTLPATVDVGGGVYEDVNWDLSGLNDVYELVEVTGTTTSTGATVVAEVEIIPPADNPLVYFVDAGRNGASTSGNTGNYPTHVATSRAYNLVSELAGSTLLNNGPDGTYGDTSVYNNDTWGHDYSKYNLKKSVVGGDPGSTSALEEPDKYLVGLRTNDAAMEYYFTLEPGKTYTLTSGHVEFYTGSQGRSRVFDKNITYTVNGTATTEKIGAVSMSYNANAAVTKTKVFSTFTVPDDADGLVMLSFAQTSGEAPMYSWIAIAEGEVEEYVEPNAVHLDGYDIASDNVNGLTYKGYGLLSGNSTSDLLLDYKSQSPEAYEELLEYLFGGDYPLMTHIKLEMGNDRNSSTGPESATKRATDEDANVTRNPGWQLIADAKKINPDITTSILKWVYPSWTGGTNENFYTWYKESILNAYVEYGYIIDYMNPNTNEHWGGTDDIDRTISFSNWIAAETKESLKTYFDSVGYTISDSELEEVLAQYHDIKMIVSDEVGTVSTGVGTNLKSNTDFYNAVDVVGYHYSPWDDANGAMKWWADEADKEVWNSEAQATFSNSYYRPVSSSDAGIGGGNSALEMMNAVLTGFSESRRTTVIYQPALGSFYEGGQYSYKELVSARDPWSGYIHYDTGLLTLRHVTSFATVGWENEDNTAGIWRGVPQASYSGGTGTNPNTNSAGEPMYMTLASPDADDFSIVFNNDSSKTLEYKISYENMNLPAGQTLDVWETRAADNGELYDANYMQNIDTLRADANGYYTLIVKPYSIVTVTTLDRDKDDDDLNLPKDGERTVLDTDSTGDVQDTTDEYLYADDFDYTGKTVTYKDQTEDYIESRGGDTGAMARYTHTQNGAFEVYKASSDNYVLRQQLDTDEYGVGGAWNGGDPVTTIGDFRWTNYKASVDVLIENDGNGANYASVQIRQTSSPSNNFNAAYGLRVYSDGSWQLLNYSTVVASGTASEFNTGTDVWNNIALQGAGDTITAYINGVQVARYVDSSPQLAGRINLSSGYYFTQFDNLEITKVEGYEPYYTEAIDDFVTYDLETNADKLVYNSQWTHSTGQAMYDYGRTLSTSTGTGATLEYTFTGTGLDIIGNNGSTARLAVSVDGKLIDTSANTQTAGNMRTSFSLRGLPYDEHTVKLEVLSGTLVVDIVGVTGGNVSGNVNLSSLNSVMAFAGGAEYDSEYSPSDWEAYSTNLAMAKAVLADTNNCGIDQEGVEQLADRLEAAFYNLTGDTIVSIETVYTAVFEGLTPSLPDKVEVTLDGGGTELAEVRWSDISDVAFNAYDTVSVSGKVRGQNVTGYIEVIPAGLEYFADIGAVNGMGNMTYDSPSHLAVKEYLESVGLTLANEAADQRYSTEASYGHASNASNGNVEYKGYVAGDHSKFTTTGIYTSNSIGAKLYYYFDLSAGDYDLGVGVYDWWSGYGRSAYVRVTDADGVVTELGSVIYDNDPSLFTGSFTNTKDGIVCFELEAFSANQSPILNFIMVSDADAEVSDPVLTIDSSITNGVLVYNPKNPAAGETVTVEVEPGNGYVLKEGSLKYNDTVITADEDGNYTFTMPLGEVVLTAEFVVDTSRLENIVAECETLDENDYTPASWSAFNTALTAAKAVLADTSATPADVNSAYYDLIVARLALVRVNDDGSVNTFYLELLIADAEAIDLTGVRPALAAALKDALDDAKFVLADASATQADVNEAATKLLMAIINLKDIIDRSDVERLLDLVDTLEESDYTPASWKALEDAAALAKALDDNASQADVNAAYDALADALENLEKVQGSGVNKKALKNAINDAKFILDNIDAFIPSTVDGLQKIYERALAVYNDTDATQADVDAITEELTKALARVRVKEDKTLLEEAIKAAEDLDPNLYTPESYAILEQALEEARKVLEDDEATAEEIAAALKLIEDAQAQLELLDSGSGGTSDGDSSSGSGSDGDSSGSISGSGNAGTGDNFGTWMSIIVVLSLAVIVTLVLRKRRITDNQ